MQTRENKSALKVTGLTSLTVLLLAAMNFVQPKAAPSSERTKSGVKESGPSKGTVSRNLSIDSSQFVRTQGIRLVMGDSNRDVLLRGVVFVSNGPTPPEDKDYQGVADMHMNTVRLALEYNFFYEPNAPESYKDSGWKWLDAHVSLARKHQVYLILQMFEIEGAQFVPTKNAPFDYRTWEDAQLQARFVRLWQAIAERYRDEPQIIGYSLFCEPVVSGTVEQWSDLANRTIRAIRQVDQYHIVFVERIYGENRVRREMSGVDFPPERSFFLVEDDNAVYEFYFFERDEYTHQFAPWRADVQKSVVYPDSKMNIVYKEQPNDVGERFGLNKDYLKFYLRRQTEFGKRHNVPMFVWGFGLMRNCFDPGRGGAQWLKDVTDLFAAEALSWTFFQYRDSAFVGLSNNSEARQILSRAAEKQQETSL
ncbi:MAG: hypothetical protein DMG88_19175 [Acidobacteria bacterium]|nr:MAG: hypothetical protein DMG88_19175 [Acidobacteriota bacterium]